MEKRTLPCFVNVFEGYVLKISLRSDSDHVPPPAWFSQRQLISTIKLCDVTTFFGVLLETNIKISRDYSTPQRSERDHASSKVRPHGSAIWSETI